MKEKESLNIIEDMIMAARADYSTGAAYYFVLWGTIVMLYSLINYIGITTSGHQVQWATLLFAIGGILSFIKAKQNNQKEQATGIHDRLYAFVWSGVGICLASTWIAMPLFDHTNIIPVSLMLYALASFITGGVTKYMPSLIGSIICMLCAVAAMFVNFALQNLICAIAVLFVHVIPGAMMKSYYNHKTNAK